IRITDALPNDYYDFAPAPNGVSADIGGAAAVIPIAQSCGAVRALANDTVAHLQGAVVTLVSGSSIFIEQPDRSSAYRLDGIVSAPLPGSVIEAVGFTNGTGLNCRAI